MLSRNKYITCGVFLCFPFPLASGVRHPNALPRHAFQSLLWNLAASERIELYGREGAVEGDLVFPRNSASNTDVTLTDPGTDVLDSEAEEAAEDDEGGADEDEEAAEMSRDPEAREPKRPKRTPARLPDVHVVTKEDVEKGAFRLTDVVLPMPG